VHHADWLQGRLACGWLEAHAENYFAAGGALPALLDDLHRDYPLSIHGVGLGLASSEPLDHRHLARLKLLIDRHQPELVSEHLCWGAADGVHFNDLLPIPFTRESLDLVCSRIAAVQDTLGRSVLIEHLASYLRFDEDEIPEAEFLAALLRRTGCGLLLDLNNLYVNACNHGFDAEEFLAALPPASIGEIHLAGHTRSLIDGKPLLIDTHGSEVCESVWQLYRTAVRRFGPRPTLIEWDTDVPALEVLLAEAARADAIVAELERSGELPVRQQPPQFEPKRPDLFPDSPRRLDALQREFAAMLREPDPPCGPAVIYHHNRRANFCKALALEYPLIERIVGAEFFGRLALDFMAANPSRSGDLHHVGESFPAFLAGGLASRGSAYEYLLDLAHLEWAWQCALIAADAPALGPDAMAAFPQHEWPRLRLTLQPALRVIESPWPVHTLFVEHRGEHPAIVHLAAGGECAGVLRRNGVVEVHRLQPGDAALWKALASGQTLEAAVDGALHAAASENFELGAALTRLFALGAIADIAVHEPDA
jgi:uncharacterized protein (UPF0276 family)